MFDKICQSQWPARAVSKSLDIAVGDLSTRWWVRPFLRIRREAFGTGAPAPCRWRRKDDSSITSGQYSQARHVLQLPGHFLLRAKRDGPRVTAPLERLNIGTTGTVGTAELYR